MIENKAQKNCLIVSILTTFCYFTEIAIPVGVIFLLADE